MSPRAKTVKTTTVEEMHVPEVIEPEITQVNAQPMPFADPPSTQEEDDLKKFFEGLGGSEIIIKISKYDSATNRPRYLQDTDLDGANEAYIQQNWGEGRYLLRAYKEGSVIGSRTVLIGPPLKSNAPQPAPLSFLPALEKPGLDPLVLMQLEQMREEAKTNRELLMKLIESNMGGSKSGAMELAEVMAILKPVITPPAAAAGGGILEILGAAIPLVKQLIDLGAGGGAQEKPSWMSMVKDLGPDVLRTVGQMMQQRNSVPMQTIPMVESYQQNPPAPAVIQPALNQSQIAGIDSNQLEIIRGYMSYFKEKVRKNASPDTFINLVLDTLDEERSLVIANLLDRSYEEIATIDPEILTAVYRPWFEAFFGGLKDALSERDTTGGEGGNPDNPAANEGNHDSIGKVGS